MPRPARETSRINNLLQSHGLGRLDDRGTVSQLGYLVRDHEHFRQLIEACEPAQRPAMYDAMKASLRFPAKPLDVYMAETRAKAEREHLPILLADGSVRAFNPTEIRTPPQIIRHYNHNGGSDLIEVKLHPTDVRQHFRLTVEDAAKVSDADAIRKCMDLNTAQNAIDAGGAPKTIVLTCVRCTKAAKFHGAFQDDCVREARAAGWRYRDGKEFCPECR